MFKADGSEGLTGGTGAAGTGPEQAAGENSRTGARPQAADVAMEKYEPSAPVSLFRTLQL
ncbi:hypothetical protein QIH01_18000 [Brevibacillus brevis]|uniref:hypothetical protein n=1 Tax=Brevibacillus brevis TaxID=1393 RepID=UPI0027A78F68|nr:hypothetical protein QIH01_18000 [Brevibacillus brevis]